MRTDRLLARLEQEPRPPAVPAPVMSRTRVVLLWVTLGFYAAVVVAVLSTSWLVRLDWQVMLFRPYKQWPAMHAFLDYFVVLGQRGPTAVLVAAWLGWRSWRQRTLRPLLVMSAALLLLNVTVGAAKLGMGREGPHYATVMGSNEMFLNGDIFPSGHTANAVVTWGILAYLATTERARRSLSVIAALCALGVGATTVYLGTHWVSDVLLGWTAGLLVLLALPWCEPAIDRVERMLLRWRDRLRTGLRGGGPRPGSGLGPLPPLEVTPQPVTAAARQEEEPPAPLGEPPLSPARPTEPVQARVRLRTPGRAHQPSRPEHPPRPVGSH
ncbi:phosphatase PAP2 family protein [Streptomyces hoynatensis]|uniref:Phosphatase PAP2 family protein n=1 Tax=Streptomyces hoynatensis TaxID=1141874 RepID=A0A3A9Z5E5_9ACTN|nr:phosphatase PAP2 family protein [Streptomyces hoynatensis]RKN43732.1 phosphatase PAP2 family protein [Streptomyces hoynatensis]